MTDFPWHETDMWVKERGGLAAIYPVDQPRDTERLVNEIIEDLDMIDEGIVEVSTCMTNIRSKLKELQGAK